MGKKSQKTTRFFRVNYSVVIAIVILLVILVPSVLYAFEWKSYEEEKKIATVGIQEDIDDRIRSLKSLLNYTFFDEQFQGDLENTLKGDSDIPVDAVYDRFTAIGILGDTVRTVWYFPLIDGKIKADVRVVSSDTLIKFVPNIIEVVNQKFSGEEYLGGKYFAFTVNTAIDKTEPKSLVIGHWVLSASTENFFEPIGLCLAIVNTPALTDYYARAKQDDGVEIGLYDSQGELIYGNAVKNSSSLQEMRVVSVKVVSEHFGLNSVLYYDVFKVFYDFLKYLLTIVGLMLVLLVACFIYVKIDEKKKVAVYDSFIETFRRIREGNTSERMLSYGIEELDLVGEKFNQMMDSVLRLNEALREEERKALESEKEKDRYVIKYLSTQINKHFIFNTFSTIRAFVNLGKNEEASECIDLLCNYLRFTFRGKDFVTVEEEVGALQYYLDIQKIRYGDVTVFVDVEEQIKGRKIPQFVLQPIVENVYKHAFKGKSGEVRITGRQKGDTIEFLISDDGVGIDGESLEKLNRTITQNEDIAVTGGIGLINVQRRLKILTGEKAKIFVESCDGKGTTVVVTYCAI